MGSAGLSRTDIHRTDADRTAIVFDIQRFSVHDGPGIRTTVFFKGCPLRCRWCHNPESISPTPQYLVYAAKCTRCGLCPGPDIAGLLVGEDAAKGAVGGSATDRRDADSRATDGPATGEYPPCPHGARSVAGTVRSIGELVEAALRDRPFYGGADGSPGGVTVSGGEPLTQPEAVFDLAGRLRSEGVHVALDTSAFAPARTIERIPDAFDLVIVDLKAVSPELHREYTGVDNAGVLDAIRRFADEMPNRLWISVPLIPGVQDEREIERIEAFIRGLGPGPKARITPYHRFGDGKYRALGLEAPEFGRFAGSPSAARWQSDPNVPVSLA